MRRAAGVLGIVLLLASGSASAVEDSSTVTVIVGVGAAHGFGMAMDGVEGQARAGWTAGRILDLFYPGSVPGSTGGTIRVGLGVAPVQRLVLPGGGVVADSLDAGLRTQVGKNATIVVSERDGKLAVDGISGAGSPEDDLPTSPTPVPTSVPTTEPVATVPPPPTQAPSPTPKAKAPEPKPSVDPGLASKTSIWVIPTGEPALTLLESTGRRYRGTFEIRRAPTGGLLAINHVGLETYVAGIAEEKGQGWPQEGLKTLAIAARTLAAATMTWYAKHHADGYDICPSANCQVYLGYDGEEPAMTQATAATAGQIRLYKGSPILAMYHGNGGGQTESYARMAGQAEDVHPYLSSVKYPYADPSRWRHKTTMAGIATALAADPDVSAVVTIPRPLERIEIVETGETPRVAKLRLEGGGVQDTMSGKAFAKALGLRSTWFGFAGKTATNVEAAAINRSAGTVSPPRPASSRSWPLAYVALLLATVAMLGAGVGVLGGPAPRAALERLQSKARPVVDFVRRRRKGV